MPPPSVGILAVKEREKRNDQFVVMIIIGSDIVKVKVEGARNGMFHFDKSVCKIVKHRFYRSSNNKANIFLSVFILGV